MTIESAVPQRASFRVIKDEIERRIATALWKPGALIPGEEALAVEFGAARATVNRALRELAEAGLVERRRKAGTRVALFPVREARFVIPVVGEAIRSAGARYAYRLLARIERPAGTVDAARIAVRPGAGLVEIRCLHLADGRPYQFEDRLIALDVVPAAADESFEGVGPNEWLVGAAPFSRATVSLLAAGATREEARHLGLSDGTPVFVAERATWLLDRQITSVRLVHPPTHRLTTEF